MESSQEETAPSPRAGWCGGRGRCSWWDTSSPLLIPPLFVYDNRHEITKFEYVRHELSRIKMGGGAGMCSRCSKELQEACRAAARPMQPARCGSHRADWSWRVWVPQTIRARPGAAPFGLARQTVETLPVYSIKPVTEHRALVVTWPRHQGRALRRLLEGSTSAQRAWLGMPAPLWGAQPFRAARAVATPARIFSIFESLST